MFFCTQKNRMRKAPSMGGGWGRLATNFIFLNRMVVEPPRLRVVRAEQGPNDRWGGVFEALNTIHTISTVSHVVAWCGIDYNSSGMKWETHET